ncbi:hypothetical protein AB0N14_21190 [Streptomyces sp. NPDC051104]|uniref:hypothetical protein n=1 Tax=Streptomyces sp. NPDC051104 TaxID=3155044 RepID=UPI003448F95F
MTEQTEQTEGQRVVEPAPGAPLLAPPPLKKERRALRALLRWTAAVAVFAVAGGATVYGITGMKRTDLPGLVTASDGRWEYPPLVKPPLPSGSPGPFAEGNNAGAHYADLRALLLPAPEGATADAALRGTDGWLPTRTFLAEFADRGDRDELGQLLTDNGLRHVAARGWNTPDGTHTRIYLLQFDTAAVADEFLAGKLTDYNAPRYAVRGAAEVARDDYPVAARVEDVKHQVFAEVKPYGAEQVREAYLSAGDTLAMIVQSRKGGAKAVPFQQTIALQSQLLG